jgi:hypothetical protein
LQAGEFFGYPEWQVVHEHCKPRFIGLHDTTAFKNARVLALVKAGATDYELVNENNQTKHGAWAMLRRKAGV